MPLGKQHEEQPWQFSRSLAPRETARNGHGGLLVGAIPTKVHLNTKRQVSISDQYKPIGTGAFQLLYMECMCQKEMFVNKLVV